MRRGGDTGGTGLHQRPGGRATPVKSHPLGVKSYPLELALGGDGVGRHGSLDEEAQLAMLASAASTPHIAIPSALAFYALLAVPAALWYACLVSGIVMFEGLPANKRDVQHFMLWFDVHVFRTLAGPALPFLVLLLRLLGVAAANAVWARAPSHAHTGTSTTARLIPEPTPRSHAVDALTAGVSVQGDSTTGGPSLTGMTAPTPPLPPRIRATLCPRAALVYLVATAVRMLLYTLHLAVQGARRQQEGDRGTGSGEVGAGGSNAQPLAFMSDHILLGASVSACLQVEVVCGMSDMIKLEAWGVGLAGQVASGTATVAAFALGVFVALDMHFTASHFHHRPESVAAVLLGSALFQVPLLIYVIRQFRQAVHRMALEAGRRD